MQAFSKGFQDRSLVKEAVLGKLKNIIKGGRRAARAAEAAETAGSIVSPLAELSRNLGATAGAGVEAAGAAVAKGGKLMQKYPGAVLPGAGAAYLGYRFLSEKPKTQQTYYYPYGGY